ncbi:MAG: alpha/beta hydrolase [Anaerolineae bacterium]|jgi:pimeloyl-ACP methyl ester carboxylesterase|nr:alpha/beta hydrolase [Anaerolineae bacterium]
MDSHSFRFPPPGQRIEVDGVRLHVLQKGEGRPTVVLEPALGSFALQWMFIQGRVAASTQVIAYDRAGQGWSDPSSQARTPAQLAHELHTLLVKLAIQPPYLLVGHSFGGLLVRAYAGYYPEEVAGVVLVDSSHPDQYEQIPNFERLIKQVRFATHLLTFASRIGLGKFIANKTFHGVREYLSTTQWEELMFVASRPEHHETVRAEFAQYRRFFGADSEIPKTLGDLPLTVVTAGDSLKEARPIGQLTAAQQHAMHLKLQAELVNLSSQGQQVTIEGATHLSIVTHPKHAEQVAEVIKQMVDSLRNNQKR